MRITFQGTIKQNFDNWKYNHHDACNNKHHGWLLNKTWLYTRSYIERCTTKDHFQTIMAVIFLIMYCQNAHCFPKPPIYPSVHLIDNQAQHLRLPIRLVLLLSMQHQTLLIEFISPTASHQHWSQIYQLVDLTHSYIPQPPAKLHKTTWQEPS